jgi:hypothetical protein
MALPESLAPTEADRNVFDAIQDHPRVCAKCLNPALEELDAPSEEWSEARDRERTRVRDPAADSEASRSERAPSVGTSTEAIAGFRSPDACRTGADAETWHCSHCGATDTTTPYEPGYSPKKGEMVEILQNFERSRRALAHDPGYEGPELPAPDLFGLYLWTKEIKTNQELTTEAIYDLVPAIYRVSRERAEGSTNDEGRYEAGLASGLDPMNQVRSGSIHDDCEFALNDIAEFAADLAGTDLGPRPDRDDDSD